MDAVVGKPKRAKTGGRKKGSRNRLTILHELKTSGKDFELAKACQEFAPKVVANLVHIADQVVDLRAASQANGLLLAYGYGKPRERVEITGTLRLEQEMVQAAALIRQHMLTVISGGTIDVTPQPHGNVPNGQLVQPLQSESQSG